MFTTETYIQSIKSTLESNSQQLINNLKEISKLNFFKDIELLDFTIFVQMSEASIMMYSMDREANEVFYEGKDASIYSGSHEVFPEFEFYSVPESKMDEFDEFFEDNENVLTKEQEKVFINWFVSCWKKAELNKMELPMYVGMDDAEECFELQKMKIISSEDRWSD